MKYLKSNFYLFSFLIALLLVNNCSAQSISLQKKTKPANTQNLEVPKIYVGDGKFSQKRIFRSAESTKEKQITGLYVGATDREKVTNILATNDKKAFILGFDGNVKKEFSLRFKYYSTNPKVEADKITYAKVKDIDGEGNVEILGNTVLISAVFDLQGNIVWKYKGGKEYGNFYDVLVKDLDEYGKDEIITITDKQIEVFDAEGESKWLKKLPVAESKKYSFSDYYAHIADFTGDEKKEILVGNTVFDNKGNIVAENKVSKFVGFLDGKDGKPLLGKFENGQLIFSDIEGNVKEKYNSPLSDLKRRSLLPNANGFGMTEAKFLRAKLQNKTDENLLVLATAFDQEIYQRFHILYIYDANGKVIYMETLKSLRSLIAALPSDDGTEKLLLSTDGKLNLYSIK